MAAPSQELVDAVQALFGSAFRISRPYGDDHDGVDIKAATGTDLGTIDEGTVSYARDARTDSEDHRLKHWAKGGGNVVNIDIGGNRTIQYAHLDTIAVKVGDNVARGQLIGTVGATGNATGPHVHFGLWHHGVGMIEPTSYLAPLAGQAPAGPPAAVVVPMANITTVELYEPARHFIVPAGTAVHGYDPTRPGMVVRDVDFVEQSGANAAAKVVIAWPGRDLEPVPHGTFLQVADGAFAGLYIKSQLAVLDAATEATIDTDAVSAMAAPTSGATITLVEQFDPERQFRVPPGTILRGFDPARPGKSIRESTVVEGSGAHAVAKVVIAWPNLDPQPIPHGTFLAVSTGDFAGLYIPAQLVALDPAPAADVQGDLDADL